MDRDTEDRILEAVKLAAKDGKLSCTMARKLAGELNVPVSAVGEACNRLKIKIKACELGCF